MQPRHFNIKIPLLSVIKTTDRKEAQKHQCKVMRLCTGVDNIRAMSFYEKNQWNQRAVVYKKKVEVPL